MGRLAKMYQVTCC